MNALFDDQPFERSKDNGWGVFPTGPIGRRLISLESLIFAVKSLQKRMHVFDRVEMELEGRLRGGTGLIIAAQGLCSMRNANFTLSVIVEVWSSLPILATEHSLGAYIYIGTIRSWKPGMALCNTLIVRPTHYLGGRTSVRGPSRRSSAHGCFQLTLRMLTGAYIRIVTAMAGFVSVS